MERKKSTKKTYSEDYIGAILEEIRSDFKVFGEGLNDVRWGVENLEVRFDQLEVKVDKMDLRLGSVENRLGSVEEKVDFLIEDVDEVKANVVDIKTEMKSMNKKLDNKAEKKIVDNHEKRLFKLEKSALAIS